MYFEKLAAKGTAFLGTKYPILCGAMTWVSNFELMSAVAANGGFPVLAGGNAPADIFEKEIDRCIAEIKGPFAVNMITIAPAFKSHLDIMEKKNVPFAVFAGSLPGRNDIKRMKDSGKKVLTFASEASIASQMIKFGTDALILEGSEAGGHIGHVSLMVLLQQILFEYTQLPIFVGGGVANGRMVAHLLAMGAAGVQLGTRFVMSNECTAHPKFKEAFIRAKARQAIATPQYDAKLPVVAVRAIKNKAHDEFGKLQLKLIKELEAGTITREKAQEEVESFWIGALRRAVVDGDVENGSVMAGQSVGLIDDVLPMQEIFASIIRDAEAELVAMKQKLDA